MDLVISQHARERIQGRDINFKHIAQALKEGEVQPIEDGRYQIIIGIEGHSKLKVVFGVEGKQVSLITAYYKGKLDNGVK